MMNKVIAPMPTKAMRLTSVRGRTGDADGLGTPGTGRLLIAVVLILLVALAGCESDEDCLNCGPDNCFDCVDLPPPVVPTGVHSISGNNEVIVQWYDIAYAPYDDSYNANVETYYIYSRFYENGDEYNYPDREFDYIGRVDWDENYDGSSGQHWFYDTEAVNGEQYEYAVAAVNAAGLESALSFEFVADAPLPMSPLNNNGWFIPVQVYNPVVDVMHSAFNFRRAGLNPAIDEAGVVSPAATHNIQIIYEGAVAYALAEGSTTRIQDFGVFGSTGQIAFEGVSWAPENGYSGTGKLELVVGHVYVVEIIDSVTDELHYAKFGVDSVSGSSVGLIWAYQLIAGLPELKAPGGRENTDSKPQLIKL